MQSGLQLRIDTTQAAGFYEVKVTTNMTLTPEIMVKISITNPVINGYGALTTGTLSKENWFKINRF